MALNWLVKCEKLSDIVSTMKEIYMRYISGSGISVWHHGLGRRWKKQTFETGWQPDAGKKLLCLVKTKRMLLRLCLSVSRSFVRSVCLSVGWSVCRSVCLFVCLSLSCLSLSVCLSFPTVLPFFHCRMLPDFVTDIQTLSCPLRYRIRTISLRKFKLHPPLFRCFSQNYEYRHYVC